MRGILLFLMLLSSAVNAQVESYKELLQFYPLCDGDYWEYKTSSISQSIFLDSSAYSIMVNGDTTMPNGIQYKVLRKEFFYPDIGSYNIFERVDTSAGCLYMWTYDSASGIYETKLDSLFAQPGDTMASSWIGLRNDRTICDSIINISVLGLPTKVRSSHNIPLGGSVSVHYCLAQGIGFYEDEEGYDFGSSGTELVYAKVDGKEYGTRMFNGSHVDSLREKLDYYPMQVGDFWEYKELTFDESTLSYDSSAYSIEVVGETTLIDSYRYKILRRKMIYPSRDSSDMLERIDSLTGCVYKCLDDNVMYVTTIVTKLDSLFAEPGDTTTSSWIDILHDRTVCDSIVRDTILGLPTEARYAHNISQPGGNGVGYRLAKGIGLFREQEGYDFGTSTTSLVYAEINGARHGTKIPDAIVERRDIPASFALLQNYPNPFNPSTVIQFEVPPQRGPFGTSSGFVTLKVYDVLGRELRTLVNKVEQPGSYTVTFDASGLPSGVYFYRLQAGSFARAMKALLLK